MNSTARTLAFVAVAALSVAVAAGTYFSNKPVDLEEFSDVGSLFYPKFDDPNAATGLQVAAYDDNSGKTELFKVEFKDGLWRIPSHHDYPADGQDKLSKTAASMVGVTREALVERSKAAQKRYGVVDPLDKDSSTEGRGDRITLYKGDETLVDFIVGKKLPNSENLYYVRRADEDRIYTADLGKFEVSTKFADWIKKDILEVSQDDVREIIVGRYHVDEVQGKVIQEGRLELDRGSDTADWQLKGLKPDEKLKSSEVTTLVRSLDDLQIVGVRPKPEALSAGLKGDGGSISIDPFVQQDMMEKGVFISSRGDFVYNEGKVNVGTSDGVVYELGFGEEFSGNEVDIEVGKKPAPAAVAEKLAKEIEEKPGDKQPAEESKDKKENKDDKNAANDADSKSDEKKEDGEKAPETKKSRYLFVTVLYDKKLLGDPPVPPVKPQAPSQDAKKADAASKSEKADKSPEEKAKTTDKPASDRPDATPADAEKKSEENNDSAGAEDSRKAYEAALEEYKLQQEVYETKKKAYDQKAKDGEKRVAELNRRFADWYYVISEDVFDKLKLKRDDLVEKAEAEKKEQPAETGAGLDKMPAGTGAESAAPAEKAKPAEPASPQDTGKEASSKESSKDASQADGKKEEAKTPAPAGEAMPGKSEQKPASQAESGEAPKTTGEAASGKTDSSAEKSDAKPADAKTPSATEAPAAEAK